MPVNLLQCHGSVGIFDNKNFFVQSKSSHLLYLSDNNNNSNDNNLTIGLLILFNKIALVLLLLNLMFMFKVMTLNIEKSGPYFRHSSYGTCFVGFIFF